MSSPAEQKRLMDEAIRLFDLAEEIRKKQNEGAAAAAKAGTGKGK